MEWKGVMPAMTTAFDEGLKVDHDFMAKHALWLIENGCSGLVGYWDPWANPQLSRLKKSEAS